jgi:hypothetical protein
VQVQPTVLAICYATSSLGNGQPSRSKSIGWWVWACRLEPQATLRLVRPRSISMPLGSSCRWTDDRAVWSLARINRPRAHGRTHTIEPFGVWIASTATRARAHEQHDDCLVWSLDSSRQSRAVVQVQVQSLLVLGTLCCDLGCYHLAHASCRSTAIVPFGLVKSFWGCQGVFRVLIRTRRTERKYWERCSFHTEKQNKLRVCLVRGVKV